MNIEAYISSGIIEGYVFGLLSPDEEEDLDHLRTLYPEVETEIKSIEKQIERIALRNAVQPSVELKMRFLKMMEEEYYRESHETEDAQELPFDEGNNQMTVHTNFRLLLIALLLLLSLTCLLMAAFYYFEVNSK